MGDSFILLRRLSLVGQASHRQFAPRLIKTIQGYFLAHPAGQIAHTFVIFHYGIFPEGIAKLKDAGVSLHALCTWHEALKAASEAGYLSPEGIGLVEAFLADPDGWSQARGDGAPAPKVG